MKFLTIVLLFSVVLTVNAQMIVDVTTSPASITEINANASNVALKLNKADSTGHAADSYFSRAAGVDTALAHHNRINDNIGGSGVGAHKIRSFTLTLDDGATPGTNVDVLYTAQYNGFASVTNADDMAKSGTDGSFSLDAGGTIVTMNVTENIIGILSASIMVHDLNSSSTTEMYFPYLDVSGNNLTLSLYKRGTNSNTDLTTILDAGDKAIILISVISE